MEEDSFKLQDLYDFYEMTHGRRHVNDTKVKDASVHICSECHLFNSHQQRCALGSRVVSAEYSGQQIRVFVSSNCKVKKLILKDGSNFIPADGIMFNQKVTRND